MSNFKANLVGRGTIEVNGKKYQGTSVTVKNGKVIVDGRLQEDVSDCQTVTVNIEGSATLVQNENGNVTIGGEVKGDVKTTNGDIHCLNVHGNVKTTNGDIDCYDVAGDVETVNGDISRKW
ncbi:hypothetical protein VPFG_00188 [Vibrio phage nt-1]|uniref:Polymer-forming cytoskeletal protein n=1 Tax=Vibrio phage nt-1 TaxID=115992 RepID=R9TGG3_9CAUD|nr:hypothetical protein VPFG_00188 [Vibrio phage nt-1]AGN30188.1 hypothetical protein VPFG_00188 [Vibrio phage nt-1]